MEDLDDMIMKTLSQIGCSFCKDVDSLALLGIDDIFEAIVRLLCLCDPRAKEIPSLKLPSQMTIRYREATRVADAVKSLGIREKIGYHTILYPNLYDIRNIMIFLIEKLPKDSIIEEVKLLPIDDLRKTIGSQIRQDLNKEWTPGYCECLRMKKERLFWLDNENDPIKIPVLKSGFKRSKLLDHLGILPDSPICEATSFQPQNIYKAPQPKPRQIVQRFSSEIETIQVLDVEKNESLERLIRIREALKLHGDRHRNLIRHQYILREEYVAKAEKWDMKAEKMMKILSNPDSQIECLHKFIAEREERRTGLEDNFANWKRKNSEILGKLKSEKGSEAELETHELIETNGRLKKCISEQKKALGKMKKQLSKESSGEIWDRNKFLSRIVYLANNVNGQKAEISTSLQDCKRLEKEKRNLFGSLERTFTVVNNWLYQSAEADLRLKNAYDLVMKLHIQCSSVVKNMDEIYQMCRQKDTFDDEIEVLKQQNAESNLDQILKDLILIQRENIELEEELK
ncbi:unnamed protein product [Bursaphelenchus xylophilus]|uniref:Coiled-coil domain-containing protein 22 homolog n=1 Tax=Bursaphelenchus xylophilus TaxID=6326 RepID=A0A1I7S309_BURXY|nr:unnamed protein product [Bursaphelenchus xylophilus]CAG9116055.1 unnamed protein product [Bursaphelenchus xylophilus]